MDGWKESEGIWMMKKDNAREEEGWMRWEGKGKTDKSGQRRPNQPCIQTKDKMNTVMQLLIQCIILIILILMLMINNTTNTIMIVIK